MDKRRQVRPELDPIVLPQVRSQPGKARAVHPGLQLGQLLEKAGLAGGNEALVVDQSADQNDQDRRSVSAPCQKTGVSARRGFGDQGNADRYTGTDQLASLGTRIVHSGSDVMGDSVTGLSAANRPPQGRRLDREGDLAFLRLAER